MRACTHVVVVVVMKIDGGVGWAVVQFGWSFVSGCNFQGRQRAGALVKVARLVAFEVPAPPGESGTLIGLLQVPGSSNRSETRIDSGAH